MVLVTQDRGLSQLRYWETRGSDRESDSGRVIRTNPAVGAPEELRAALFATAADAQSFIQTCPAAVLPNSREILELAADATDRSKIFVKSAITF